MLKGFEGADFNMSNTHLQVINTDAFLSFGLNMRRFIFENNEITYIAPKAFNKFKFVEKISFKNSNIFKLTNGVFDGTNADVLDLSQNLLYEVNGIFDGLYVAKLNLSKNTIKEIEVGAFDRIIFCTGRSSLQIQYLDLSNNLIEMIKPDTFKCVNPRKCFRVLNLMNNEITAIENGTFANLRYLEELRLSSNKITKLHSNSFKGLLNLNFLYLQNNRIQEIPMGMFGDVQRLTLLDLSQNFLMSLNGNTFSGLLTLQILNLSHNNLQDLKNSYLFPLIQLRDLDITNIRIHEIYIKDLLETHFRMRSLTLNDNFWTCKQLMQIYKEMNHQFGGFSSPSSYFNVPNLHGIACSRGPLPTYENLTFEKFLNIISQDHEFTKTLELTMMQKNDVPVVNKSIDNDKSEIINSIHTMFIIFIVIVVISFVYFVIKEVLMWLHNYDFIKSNRLSFLYTQSSSKIQVL
ncbi:hypothetical protein RN001_000996 [Aquatica leii]|uniref:Uncharacterized protein n=1 Tax=Aquatica leii TaxID=1421715 RepID=A0AAN7PAW7_9COLE|nr:hypothetical protein RN001_000996 [Aquatica leii]